MIFPDVDLQAALGRALSLPEAVRLVQEGGVVAYPTETFFGVGCKASHSTAVRRVYEAKQRPLLRPLPVLGADWEQLVRLALFDPAAEALGRLFWPGPLTLLLPAQPCVPLLVTAGTGRIAVRISSHPTAQALALAAGEALVSSSANVSGRPPVSSREALDPLLLRAVDGVVEEGPPPEGALPSTLAEMLEGGRVRLLREGAVPRAALENAGYEVL